jgi:hypothetical protein
MNSWRKTVLDILNGVDKDTDETVRQAIDRCLSEPPAESNGTLSEAVRKLASDEARNRAKVKELGKRINVMDRWTNDLDDMSRANQKPLNALQRAYSAWEDMNWSDDFSDRAVESLEKKTEAAEAIILPLMKAQSEKEAKYNKTPCGKIFQELVFGWKQGRGSREVEPNTDKEENIKLNIGNYVGGNDVNPTIVKAFKELKACTKQYPEALRPTVTHAWRGVAISVKDAIRFLPMKALLKSSDRLQIGGGTYLGARGVYKPRREIESWAAEPKIAHQFANEGSVFSTARQRHLDRVVKDAKRFMSGKSENDPYALPDLIDEFVYAYKELLNESDLQIVFHMKVDSDFVFAEWFADTLAQSEYLGKESEVTHVSEVGAEKPTTVYVEERWIDAVRFYNEKVQELREIMGAKMPKKIQEIEFE